MRRAAAIALLILLVANDAHAGAWTLNRHKLAVFTGVTASTAGRLYDDTGGSAKQIVFRKLLVQSWMEYGLTGSTTLYAAPEYVTVKSNMKDGVLRYHDSAAIEVGMRGLLLSKIGMLSIQVSGRTGGAFDMSISSDGESGQQFEARLLYGTSFKLLKRDTFIDVQIAQRWISPPRPNEIALDLTFGCWLSQDDLVLVQSFNFATYGIVSAPYQPYQLSKLQVSTVHRVTKRWSFQSGYFLSLAGRNIVKEEGVLATLWYKT